MNRPRGRSALAWIAVLLAGALAAALRYGLVEPAGLGDRCAASGLDAPAWCSLRDLVVQGFLHDVYGVAALVATAFALLHRRHWSAAVAASLGLLAIELYCYESGALALLVGMLLLVHADDPARPHRPGHPGQQDVQAEP